MAEFPPDTFHLEAVRSALLAPSLVLFSQSLRLPKLQALAHSHYGTALSHVNISLADQHQSRLDSLLLTVLLLSLFEALSMHGRRSPVSWRAHVGGLVELLRLRGPRQFDGALGQRLFLHAAGSIRSDCAQRRIKPPPELSILQNALVKKMNPSDPHLRLAALLDRFADLRAATEGESYLSRLQRGMALDQGLEDLLDELNQLAPFQVIDASNLPESILSYDMYAHRYTSLGMMRVWNTVRILRLFANELIAHDLMSGEAASQLTRERHAEILEQITVSSVTVINDILHSVPLALESSDAVGQDLSAKLVIYPLAAIAVSHLAPKRAIDFARNSLASIGTRFDVAQANDLATMVLQMNDLEDW